MKDEYITIADESFWNADGVRCIAAVTVKASAYQAVSARVAEIFTAAGCTSFSFAESTCHSEYRAVAPALLGLCQEFSASGDMTANIVLYLSGDTTSSPPVSTDAGQLNWMCQTLLKEVAGGRWPGATQSTVLLHRNNAWDIPRIQSYMFGVGETKGVTVQVRPISEAREPLVALADLFASMTAAARNYQVEFASWKLTGMASSKRKQKKFEVLAIAGLKLGFDFLQRPSGQPNRQTRCAPISCWEYNANAYGNRRQRMRR